jgi:hypothetical protein
VTENPYHFAVKVTEHKTKPSATGRAGRHSGITVRYGIVIEGGDMGGGRLTVASNYFRSEAEANEHADMVVAALREASRER